MFNDQELSAFVNKCEEELAKSEVRRSNALDILDVEEETQDVINLNMKCEEGMENDFKLEIANLFGKIFMSHKEKSMKVFQHLYENHIKPCFTGEPKQINIEYGIFLIDDSIDHLKNLIPIEVMKHFYEILMKYTYYDSLDINQSSFFGLGILAEAMGPANFAPYFENSLKRITDSIEKKKKPEDIMILRYNNWRENVVSALGKILQVNWNSMNENTRLKWIQYWFKQLPLIHDHSEAKLMH